MQAATVHRYGGPDVVAIESLRPIRADDRPPIPAKDQRQPIKVTLPNSVPDGGLHRIETGPGDRHDLETAGRHANDFLVPTLRVALE